MQASIEETTNVQNAEGLSTVTEPIDTGRTIDTSGVEAALQDDVGSDETTVDVSASPIDKGVSEEDWEPVVRARRPNSRGSESGIFSRRKKLVAAGITALVVGTGIGSTQVDQATTDREPIEVNQGAGTDQDAPIQVNIAEESVPHEDTTAVVSADRESDVNTKVLTVPEYSELSQQADVDMVAVEPVTPITTTETIPVVPDNIERSVVGPEAYPGEVTIIRSLELVNFLINNSNIEAMSSTTEMNEDGSGTLYFAINLNNRNIQVTATGEIKDSMLVLDKNSPLEGIYGGITITDTVKTVTVLPGAKQPAIKVTQADGATIATDAEVFAGIPEEDELASSEGASITADVFGVLGLFK